MSKKIDERVVEMRFDNKNFENNVKTSMSTLDKLKQRLRLNGANKGLEEISRTSKNFNMNGVASAVETVQAKFSAMQVVGITALANITNQAVNAGKRIATALTITPIKTGFKEYETQMGAVQTILANTESKGSTLQDVNRALNELNVYADKTIYNFTEMTKNIGTFTAAGVDLDKSVSSIKGIANLAAVSGSTSQQASTAMYQLSQALAAGKVSLMDWNSVVNAGMGGELFQNALKRTARQMGHNVDEMIEKYGSFRESLTKGNWLTTEVLTETLTQLSGAYTEVDLIAQGYTEDQAKQITKLAETAVSAATEVKTFTQLWDTLKEAAQSGWTQSWQTIVGDFGEAKELLTGISNVVGDMINKSAESRNKVLSEGLSTGWKQLLNKGISDEELFRDTIKLVAKDHGVAIEQMIEDAGSFEKTLKKGWITGDILAESLDKMTTHISGMSEEQLKASGYTSEQISKLKELNQAVKDGTVDMDEFAKKMSMKSGRENIIEGLSNIFKTIGSSLAPIQEAYRDIFPALTGEQLYSFTERFRKFTEELKVSESMANKIKKTFSGLFSVFDLLGKGIKSLVSPFIEFTTSGGIGNALEIILSFTASIGDFFTTINESAGAGKFFEGLTTGLTTIASKISNTLGIAKESLSSFGGVLSFVGNIIGSVVAKIGQGIKWIAETLSIGDIFAGLAGGGIFIAAKKFAGLFDKIKEVIGGFFDSSKDKISIGQQFSDMLGSVHDSLASFSSGIKATTLLTIAGAVGILSASLRSLSGINPGNLIISLSAIGSMMLMLNLSFKSIASTLNKFGGVGSIKAGFALVGMATSIKILSGALINISEIDFDDLVKGLITLSAGMVALTSSLKIVDKANISIKTSLAIITLAQSCKVLSEALSSFGQLSWSEIQQGLTAMGGALLELGTTISILNRTGGIKSVFNSTGLLIATFSLSKIADGLKQLGNLTWEEIGRGLSAMGGALTELTASLGILSAIGGFGSFLGGTSILIAVQALDEISLALSNLSSLTWEEIGRGLTAMGGALAELAIIVGTLGKISLIGGLLGSGAILLVVQGLVELSHAFSNFASMSWEEIEIGLTGMGGALSELAVITGLLGKIGGLGSLLGSGSLLLSIQGLGELAKALKEFGSMSWEEIGRGLTAMGAALGETALGGILNTLSGLGAMSIAKVAEPLGVLADSVKKWSSVEVPPGLGAQIGSLAGGIFAFTLDGFGANAISTVAKPLGDLATSVTKWTGILIPDDLGNKLRTLASGVKAFTFSGFGADSIAVVAGPIGTLAESIMKWSTVIVPDGMKEKLTGLAEGVKSFTFANWGAGTISEIAEPLGTLADAVQRWSNVIVPEGMKENLISLAEGVQAFNLGWFADYDVNEVVEPLGDLASAVQKWNGVVVPSDLSTNLTGLATGLRGFENLQIGDLSNIGKVITNIGKSIKDISGIDFSSVSNGLSNFISSINKINVSTDSFANLGNKIVNGLVVSINAGLPKVKMVTQSLAHTAINSFTSAVSVASGKSSWAGRALVNGLVSGMKAGTGLVRSVANSIINTGLTTINSKNAAFQSAGIKLATSLMNGIKSKSAVNGAKSAVLSMVNSAASAATSANGRFISAGLSAASGFASGIRSGSFAASVAAAAMANAAAQSARKNLKINSPSKVFRSIGSSIPEGFVQGIGMFSNLIKSSSMNMSDVAINSATKAISKMSNIINSGAEVQPTIRPVVDLDDVYAGARAINDSLTISPSIGVMSNIRSISSAMNARNQNGANDDVVNAIRKLDKTIRDNPSTVNNINGVTYDDGTNIVDAVATIVRAAKVERRS